MKLFAGILLILVGAWAAHGAPGDPAPRPLLLLAPFNGEKLVVRAATATAQGTILTVATDAGQKAGYERTALVATLPWYTDAELTAGSINTPALLALYDEASRQHPEFQRGLAAEAARVRAGVATLENARQQKLAAVFASGYDPAHPYTPEGLRERLRAAEEAIGFAPAQRAKIEQAVAPFREHLSNLEAGRTYSAHGWQTADSLRKLRAQAEEKEKRAAFLSRLEVPMEAQVVGADRVGNFIRWVCVVDGGLIVLGIVLIFRRARVAGIALVLLPLAGSAGYAYLLFSPDLDDFPVVPKGAAARDGAAAVTRILYDATVKTPAEIPPDERCLHIDEADVNGFLATNVKVLGGPALGAINLGRLAVKAKDGGVVICEYAEWRGQPLLIRHDLTITARDGKPVVADDAVHVGRAPIFEPLANVFRDGLTAQLSRFFGQHHLLASYAASAFTRGGTALVLSTSPPPPVAATAPSPIPTPDAAETPAAAPGAGAAPVVAATTTAPTPEPDHVAAELPPLSASGITPGPDNTFYIYAIWDGINGAPEGEIEKQMDRLRAQFGRGNRFHRIGFAFILGGSEAKLRSICTLARAKNLAVGVILGAQTHSGAGKHEVEQDFRVVQWRLRGDEWRGGSGGRDGMLPTPSRYCKLVRDPLEIGQRQRCEMLRRVVQSYPGVITCINGTIEEELADGGQTDDGKLADYSPFAVTEFRDWLRHTGQYDADGGKYAGEGAPEQITGAYTFFKGKRRSPYYGAADPDTSVGDNSFNGRFATHCKTWTLKYWDLTAFPGKITDGGFNPTPESGAGFTENGFDAPRKRDASLWWQTWSWDYQDRDKRYPPGGKPEEAAFGFRQVMVHHFVEDMFQVAVNARLPVNLLFAHQIPGELAGAPRNRSAATPVWTGFLPINGTVGVTRFGFFDPELALRYTRTNPNSRGWGIFEWHPMPNADPKDAKLYQTASDHLRSYYRARCHHLFAGWWKTENDKPAKDFPLVDSQFARAIKDFMDSRPDQPYPGAQR